jgi:hypothetical protein
VGSSASPHGAAYGQLEARKVCRARAVVVGAQGLPVRAADHSKARGSVRGRPSEVRHRGSGLLELLAWVHLPNDMAPAENRARSDR